MKSHEILIKKYLDNQEKFNEKILLETWYVNRMTRKMDIADGSEFRSDKLPSIEALKEKFIAWVSKNKIKLRKLICVDLDYLKNRDNFKSPIDMALAIANILDYEYTNSLEIASLLTITSLDNLCIKD